MQKKSQNIGEACSTTTNFPKNITVENTSDTTTEHDTIQHTTTPYNTTPHTTTNNDTIHDSITQYTTIQRDITTKHVTKPHATTEITTTQYTTTTLQDSRTNNMITEQQIIGNQRTTNLATTNKITTNQSRNNKKTGSKSADNHRSNSTLTNIQITSNKSTCCKNLNNQITTNNKTVVNQNSSSQIKFTQITDNKTTNDKIFRHEDRRQPHHIQDQKRRHHYFQDRPAQNSKLQVNRLQEQMPQSSLVEYQNSEKEFKINEIQENIALIANQLMNLSKVLSTNQSPPINYFTLKNIPITNEMKRTKTEKESIKITVPIAISSKVWSATPATVSITTSSIGETNSIETTPTFEDSTAVTTDTIIFEAEGTTDLGRNTNITATTYDIRFHHHTSTIQDSITENQIINRQSRKNYTKNQNTNNRVNDNKSPHQQITYSKSKDIKVPSNQMKEKIYKQENHRQPNQVQQRHHNSRDRPQDRKFQVNGSQNNRLQEIIYSVTKHPMKPLKTLYTTQASFITYFTPNNTPIMSQKMSTNMKDAPARITIPNDISPKILSATLESVATITSSIGETFSTTKIATTSEDSTAVTTEATIIFDTGRTIENDSGTTIISTTDGNNFILVIVLSIFMWSQKNEKKC